LPSDPLLPAVVALVRHALPMPFHVESPTAALLKSSSISQVEQPISTSSLGRESVWLSESVSSASTLRLA
jgi:hypothetical protein